MKPFAFLLIGSLALLLFVAADSPSSSSQNPCFTGLTITTGAGNGKVWTSDANGLGTWTTPTSSSDTPWSANHDGAGYNLTDVGAIVATNTLLVGSNSATASIHSTNVFQVATVDKRNAFEINQATGKIFAQVPTTFQDVVTNNGAVRMASTLGVTGLATASGGVTSGNNAGYAGDISGGPSGYFVANSGAFGFGSGAGIGSGSAIEAALKRVVASCVLFTNLSAASSPVFFQWGGQASLATNMTTTGMTLANIGFGSVVTLAAGRTYNFTLIVFCSDGLAADGLQVDFNGGTATATTFRADGEVNRSTTWGSSVTTLAGSIGGALVNTSDTTATIKGGIKVNAAGTFIPRFAKSGDTAGSTLTIYALSNLVVLDTPP